MQPCAAWGAIDHLLRVLFVWIPLLILIPMHRKYPWELTLGHSTYVVAVLTVGIWVTCNTYVFVSVCLTLRLIILINYPQEIFL